MEISLQATCGYTGKVVTVEQNNVDYLGDVAEIIYTFLHAAGYPYVKQVVLVKDDGEEISTL
jgi:hypothetical protein